MNTETFWKNIVVYPDTAMLPVFEDSVIVVASNRLPQFGQVRFMSETRDDTQLHYFVLCSKGGQWHIWRTPVLETALAAVGNKDKDWVVYTEGYGKIFTTGLYRGLSMAVQHRVNVLYLDYPSFATNKGMLGNYSFALRNARLSGRDFAPVFSQVKQLRSMGKMGNGRLTLFFHSMGNNIIREIVKNDLLRPINESVWVDNLVLNAACVPASDHAGWLNKIKFSKRNYVNYNPKDFTLGGARMLSLSRQLGEGTRKRAGAEVMYINFNRLCGRNHSNFVRLLSHYDTPPMALAYYRVLLHGNRINVQDKATFRESRYRKLGYSIISPPPPPDNNTLKTLQASDVSVAPH